MYVKMAFRYKAFSDPGKRTDPPNPEGIILGEVRPRALRENVTVIE
jgi:hypothetical protein